MTDLHRFGWAFSLILAVAATIFLVVLIATPAQATHCDGTTVDDGTEPCPSPSPTETTTATCEPSDPAAEPVSAWDWAAEPGWAVECPEIVTVQALSSIRVILTVGLSAIALGVFAHLFLELRSS